MTTETAATATFDDRSATGGPDLPQERRLVTEIPGPRSRALHERRTAAVASGRRQRAPVYVAAAGGGVIVDVDGNSLIDLASGIAVVSVGNSAPEVVDRVTEQVAAFTHTCFMVAPYEGYVEVCEALARLTPGDHAKKAALFNSGAEAVENAVKIARAHTGRDAVVAFDHAYHGRTNLTMAMTSKNMPYKHGFGPFAGEVYRAPMSYPFREASELTGEQAAARAIDVIEKQVGADNLACVVIEPVLGEGGFVVPAPGFLPALVAVVHRQRRGVRRGRDPVRHVPHRRLVRVRARGRRARPGHRRQGDGRRPAAGRGGRSRRDHGRRPRRWPRRHVRRQPGHLRRRPRRDRDDGAARPQRRGTRDRADDDHPAARAGREGPGDRRRPRARRDDRRRAGRARHHEARRRPGRQDQRRLPPGGRPHADVRHLRQRAPLPAAAGDPRHTCSTRRST